MRITAGIHRSRNLKTLDSDISRPTSDKVRQAIFSRIGPYFQDEQFLDVFSGTGAMALEGISRGIQHAVCIEKNPKARRIILENAKLLNEEKKISLLAGDAFVELDKLQTAFDYVFIDPPYAYDNFEGIIQKVVDHCVHDQSLIIVESDHMKVLPESFGKFQCVHTKKYGQTRLSYYEVVQ